MTAVTPGREALLEAALRKLAIRQGVRLASGGGRCVLCKAEWDEPFKDNEWHQSGCLFHEGAHLAAKPADEETVGPEELENMIADRSAGRAADLILANYVLTRRSTTGEPKP